MLAGLSSSRFQRLFRAHVGVPFRRFRLWQRMSVVAGALASGGTLTYAAHEAGFASSSHLSKSFRRMFGLRPRDLLRMRADHRVAR
ncbi:MAG: helix-turn-helix domain-containing protein [Sandaracinaceae bacterium]